MRTRQQERRRWTGLSPREFGEATGQSEDAVRNLIAAGWFGWLKEGDRRVPECMDVRGHGAKRPEYKIHPSAVDRYQRERAVDAPQNRDQDAA